MMLVGVPRVKSDATICRLMARALGESEVSPRRAHTLEVAAHDEMRYRPGFTQNLASFDHAIWLYQRSEVRGPTRESVGLTSSHQALITPPLPGTPRPRTCATTPRTRGAARGLGPSW